MQLRHIAAIAATAAALGLGSASASWRESELKVLPDFGERLLNTGLRGCAIAGGDGLQMQITERDNGNGGYAYEINHIPIMEGNPYTATFSFHRAGSDRFVAATPDTHVFGKESTRGKQGMFIVHVENGTMRWLGYLPDDDQREGRHPITRVNTIMDGIAAQQKRLLRDVASAKLTNAWMVCG
ncbi:MAG: hypothetical protein WA021_05045 [Minisyncoccia bacterium]